MVDWHKVTASLEASDRTYVTFPYLFPPSERFHGWASPLWSLGAKRVRLQRFGLRSVMPRCRVKVCANAVDFTKARERCPMAQLRQRNGED